ncbi:isoleucine--tRNA ligase [Clydaea vesicula]|uniref:Isoleucine--tRNA ligase, cytoplasmic n=1 Tax=Clydaea vesicula TaxID=447962 RepID=A0AAD5U808_9FUNG|nr:isoleucine--tRNA ligase [Clydaea vesicula]
MASRTIPDIPSNVDFPAEERKILEFWKEIDAFQTSLKLSEGRPPFSFYDGPPFATGLPHYGHLLAGTIKDVVTRYAHQTGHYVERRFGWDCHGVPIEFEIDKKLGITGPQDVHKMGIANYNQACRDIVMRYASEWERTVTRIGRWIDFRNDYKTLNLPFMESVWWVFKQLFDKNQVYRGFRILPYSTGCTTTISNFEANQNYKDVIDPAIVVSFPLVDDPTTAFLAWTTTPWTLPSNLALTVNPDLEYIKIRDEESGSIWILCSERLDIIYKDPKKAKYAVLEKYKGVELRGIAYVPPFDFFKDRRASGAFVVTVDGYVTNDSGTGVVHSSPAFGEDDLRVCVEQKVVTGENDLPCPINEKGEFTNEVPAYAGVYHKTADKQIQKDLKERGRLIRQTQSSHSYPFCWRSDTPLIKKAVPGWFVRVSNINDKLLKNNKDSYWVPEHVQEKRFANWIKDARDWNISRTRFWGTPIPLWVSEDFSEVVAVGSVAELRKLSGCGELNDIHRDKIDHITIPSKCGNGVLRRVDEVFDCWFESGSMPYAQQHYPFENKDKFEKTFPANFIAEGLDQTRGWFYTLLVIATHLFDKPPFQNLIVNGLVLASDGKKMSKRLQNYPDPSLILEKYGADVLSYRLYLVNSPVVRGEPLRFKEEGVKELIAKEHNFDFMVEETRSKSTNVMDRWVLATLQSLIKFVRQEMAAYRLYTVVPRLLRLIDDLTNWYIRFNRKRLKGENGVEDAVHALSTLHEVLFSLSKMMAPFTPFLSETMYQNLRQVMAETKEDTRSVHFLMFPEVKEAEYDAVIERQVSRMQTVIDLGRFIREKKTLSLKTPLRQIVLINSDPEFHSDIKSLENYIYEELNIREIVVTSDEEKYGVKYKLEPDQKVLGAKLKKEFGKVRAGLSKLTEKDAKEFAKHKKLVVAGVTLTEEDLKIIKFVDAKDSTFEAHFDTNVIVLLDTVLDQSLIDEGIAREVMNRVQKLRKKAGLQPIDDVNYHYEINKDEKGELENAFKSQVAYLSKSLKQDLILGKPKGKLVIEEDLHCLAGLMGVRDFASQNGRCLGKGEDRSNQQWTPRLSDCQNNETTDSPSRKRVIVGEVLAVFLIEKSFCFKFNNFV